MAVAEHDFQRLIHEAFKFGWNSRGTADKHAALEAYVETKTIIGAGPIAVLVDKIIENDMNEIFKSEIDTFKERFKNGV